MTVINISQPGPVRTGAAQALAVAGGRTLVAGIADTTPRLLTIPTYDGNPQVTHPDVVYWPKSGYNWWMAFTPFPFAARENPSIVASVDGVTWEVPTGLTNPVVSQEWAANETGVANEYNSDTDLHIQGTKLVMMWKLGIGWWYRVDTTDGINWTDPVRITVEGVPLDPVANDETLSPAVTVEADGTFALWAVDNTTSQVFRHTSTDGVDWSARQNCTMTPNLNRKWHVDVVRDGGTHHMLLQFGNGLTSTVTYWKSTDGGLTWTGSDTPIFDSSEVDLEMEGTLLYGSYRSSFVVRPDGRFDIFAALMHGVEGSSAGARKWRIALYPYVTPPT